MNIGYARVSTDEQNLALQIDALNAAGCDQIICDDGVSATQLRREGFDRAMNLLQRGDTFTVWKMDRAFRSLRHALDMLDQFEARGIEFKVITEGIDTATAMGKCFYQIRNAFGELESNLISERTKAGMAAAKARGTHVGRPRKLTPQQVKNAQRLLAKNAATASEIARACDVHSATLRRALVRSTPKVSEH